MAVTRHLAKHSPARCKFPTVITIVAYRYTLYRRVAQYQYKKYRFFLADMSLPVGARMAAAPQA